MAGTSSDVACGGVDGRAQWPQDPDRSHFIYSGMLIYESAKPALATPLLKMLRRTWSVAKQKDPSGLGCL